jgi:hypothetical protein
MTLLLGENINTIKKTQIYITHKQAETLNEQCHLTIQLFATFCIAVVI